MTTLVVAPHPDDEVLGAGGVIARRRAAGRDVHVVVVTRGAPDIFDDAFIEAGRAELTEAHRILDVTSTRFLALPAPKLDTVPAHELVDLLAGVVRDLQPVEVLLPHGGDIHGDHRAVNHAGLVAVRPRAGCPVHRVLAYETLSETEWAPTAADAFVPTAFVDISAVLETKLAALRCYRSQLKPPPDPRSVEAVEALARLRGSTAGVAAAEAFVVLRDIER